MALLHVTAEVLTSYLDIASNVSKLTGHGFKRTHSTVLVNVTVRDSSDFTFVGARNKML